MWIGCWLVGNIVGAAVVMAVAGDADGGAESLPTWALALVAIIGWTVLLFGAWKLGRRHLGGDLATAYAVRFTAVDTLGVPLGVVLQLVVMPLVYWPLQQQWPSTFSDDQLERRTQQLVDQATAGWIVVLLIVVCLGAPFVEEIVYRGMLQRAATTAVTPVVGIGAVAVLFTAIHLRPVEFVGLFVFAVVVGVAAHRSGRLGFSIATHVGFNVAAVAAAMWR